jgi:hypothetical protein
MAHYAVIEDSVVTNVIIADTLEIAQMVTNNKLCVEIEFLPNSPTLGWKYDGTNFSVPEISATEESATEESAT